MRKLFLLAIGVLFSVSASGERSTAVSTNDTSSATKLGWQLAVHSYTFQKFPILDAIDMTHALGVKYMSISGTVLLDEKRIGTSLFRTNSAPPSTENSRPTALAIL